MTDGIQNSAGLIYAYNEQGQVRLWHPLNPYCIVQVGPEMGEDINNQCAQDVLVSITIWKGNQDPYSPTTLKNVFQLAGLRPLS